MIREVTLKERMDRHLANHTGVWPEKSEWKLVRCVSCKTFIAKKFAMLSDTYYLCADRKECAFNKISDTNEITDYERRGH
jgi:hypothetical protein